jgi:hypothetical protein
VKATAIGAGFELKTVVEPLAGLTSSPEMKPISQLYSMPPLDPAAWKLIELAPEPAIPQWNTPPNDSAQTVPLGRPLSVNVTVYVTGVNTIPIDTDAEVTVSDPLEGFAVYPAGAVTAYVYVPAGSFEKTTWLVPPDDTAPPPFNDTEKLVPGKIPLAVK